MASSKQNELGLISLNPSSERGRLRATELIFFFLPSPRSFQISFAQQHRTDGSLVDVLDAYHKRADSTGSYNDYCQFDRIRFDSFIVLTRLSLLPSRSLLVPFSRTKSLSHHRLQPLSLHPLLRLPYPHHSRNLISQALHDLLQPQTFGRQDPGRDDRWEEAWSDDLAAC